jgi:lysophospholipase L1-like esterase
MWFRVLLAAVTASCWSAVALLAEHRSLRPLLAGRYSLKHAIVLAVSAALALVATGAHFGAAYERLFGKRRELLLLLVSTIVGGALAMEVAVRAFDLFGASLYREIGRYMRDLEPDPVVGYRHRPGLRATYEGASVEINDLGLRERPLAPKSPERWRVLLLGDSVTFGWGVEAGSTFGRRLEADLSARLGRAVETVNAGVCGYNTSQELGSLRAHAEAVAPDAVVLLYVDNDINPAEPLPAAAEERDALGGGGGALRSLLLRTWLGRIGVHLLTAQGPETGPGRVESMAALAAIAAECRARSRSFVVFGYRLERSPRTDGLFAEVAGVARREGFAFHDVLPWFEAVHPREVTNSFLDSHPNPRGHAMLARGMAEDLARDFAPALARSAAEPVR